MERKLAVLLFLAVFGFSGHLMAQSASGIIAPSRMTNWSNAGVQGGIQNRTSICATLSPGASASQINSAIASCPSGQVVYLNAGTYNLSSGIVFNRKSNVTLRGAGPDQTFLIFSGSGTGDHPISNIRFGSTFISPTSPPNLTSWTAAGKGATQITVGSTSNLSVGMMIFLDQLDSTSDDGVLYVCASSCSTEGSYATRSGRSQVQATRVTAINGTTLTIDPPILMDNWSSAKSPQAWWDPNQVMLDGIEDLSINGQNSQSSVEVNIGANNAQNCWVKNVRSLYGGNRDSIWFNHGLHNEVLDSYFYGGSTYSTDSAGIEASNETYDLYENNIFQHMVNAVEDGNNEGLVVAYNYMYDEYAAPSSWLPPAFFLHSGGVLMNLYEGNTANMIQGDRVHGSHALVTVFRNRLFGRNIADLGRNENSIPVELQSYTRFFNIIGNILGYPSYQRYYQDTESSNNSNPNTSNYVLGFTGQVGASGSHDDPLVHSTMMRWGNYDVVTGAVRWDSSEIPSSLPQYANAVPSSHSLPASFFLSSKPGWWGTPWGSPPWPAIGPDVTGGSGPGGHSYDIPAKLCFDNTSKDSNGILNFNAKSCYSNTPAPPAPTNLGAVAH